MKQANCFIKKILIDESISNKSKNNLKNNLEKITNNSSVNDFINLFENKNDEYKIKIHYYECKS